MTPAPLRLLCLLAHPDDETLGMGGTLAHYADDPRVETWVLTATRGEAGRYGSGETPHPGPEALGRIRERELRDAAWVLGVDGVEILGYPDGGLDAVDHGEALRRVVGHLRRLRPHVVATFDAFGGYGHPDHIAVSQLASGAAVAAADPEFDDGGDDRPHRVAKLYQMAWPPELWDAYQAAFKTLVSRVDGCERQVRPWPRWALTTSIDAAEQWERVWEAVRRHESQMAVYGRLAELGEVLHRTLWGVQTFYRAHSTVNGGRERENDLFAGIR
jgi:LmbE family N-acetylglucosaminyl deacetylase